MRSEIGGGPFQPGSGVLPPHLAGREREQDLFRTLLARLDRGEAPPGEVILYGPRGNGKTALLAWVSEFAGEATGVDVEELTPSEFDSPAGLAELLLPPSWWKTLKPDQVGVRGITWRPGKRSAAPTPAQVLALRAGRKPLVALLDEAHTLDQKVGRSLLNAAQKVRRSAPFFLVLAGTPNLRDHLASMGASFWNRGRKLRIGRLDEGAAAEAIREPLAAEDITIADDALEHLVRDSHGYPFFVQLWGEAVWARAVETSRQRVVLEDARAPAKPFSTSSGTTTTPTATTNWKNCGCCARRGRSRRPSSRVPPSPAANWMPPSGEVSARTPATTKWTRRRSSSAISATSGGPEPVGCGNPAFPA